MLQPAHLRALESAPTAAETAHKEQLDAAHKFETLLVQQLLHVMRSTVKSGGLASSEGASGQYLAMFDEAVAERVAEGGGLGLESVLMQSMSGAPAGPIAMQPLRRPGAELKPSAMGAPPSPPLPGLSGATLKLATAAYGMTLPASGKQWSREGVLTERDLASPPMAKGNGEQVHFSVREANGYRDAFKCNLFALEAARRAGFEVPLVSRTHGVGFPTSSVITQDAADGTLRGDWARPVSAPEVPKLIEKLGRGEIGVLLSASGTEGRLGHMAVVERIHHVELDASGDIRHIEFDGWEARKDGAQHLERRTWNLYGHGEDSPRARNGFGRIEVLALKPRSTAQGPDTSLNSDNRPPQADLLSSSASKPPIP